MKILAIVVTYNGHEWVDYCLSNLLKSKVPVDIMCIDNNSSDDTVSLIKDKYRNIQLIQSDHNLGFGKANNIGLKKCIDENYDYAFLLNQDAKIEIDTISKLISIHKKHPQYGILSPIHRSKENNILDYNFSNYLQSNNTPGLIDDFILGNKIKEVYDTNFVNAALWLITKDCLQNTRFFDPIFPHYGEDDDFIFRTIKSGIKVGIVPSALGNHARYKVQHTAKKEDFNSIKSRAYVSLLLNYKKNEYTKRKREFLYFRKFLIAIISDLIMLDPANLKKNIYIYMKLLRNINKI